MTPQAMQSTLVELKRKLVAEAQVKKSQNRQQQITHGRQFLEQNAKKAGVITLPSGLQYMVRKAGTGKQPKGTDSVTVNHQGP